MSTTNLLDATGLIELLFTHEHDKFDGTLQVHAATGEGYYLRIQAGQLTDLMLSAPPTILERSLFEYPALKDRDKKRIRKQAASDQRDPGEQLLESKLIPEMEIPALVLAEVERQFATMLGLEGFDVQAVNGPQENAAWRSIGDYFHLTVPLGSLILTGAQLLGRWDLVSDQLSMLKDVYYATPSSMAILRAETQHPAESAILQLLDGQRDLREVLDQIEGDPFTHLRSVEQLHHDGHVETVNPVQLFQLGCDAEKAGEDARALRLLQRAEDRGLDDFDIGFKLAELHHRLGNRQRAIDRFLSFAEKCVAQFRIDDTIRACRKVIEIDPDNMAIYERYVSLLARYGRAEEAVAEGLVLARRFREANDPERAYATLEKILEHSEANEEVLRFYLETCQAYGNDDGTQRAQRSLANLYYQREDVGRALETYQELFIGGETDAELRSRLVELHYRQGNAGAATEHLDELVQKPGWQAAKADPEARAFFQRLSELDQSDTTASQWLVADAQARQDRAEQLRLLNEHCDRQLKSEEWEEARKTAASVFALDPDDLPAGRRLADLERRCGNTPQAVEVLEQVAQKYDLRGGQDPDLPRIVDQILELDSMSTIGRDLWRKYGHASSDAERTRMNIEGTLVALVRGKLDGLTPIGQDDSVARACAFVGAELALLHGNEAEATELLVAVGTAAAAANDLGILERVTSHLERIAPQHAELATFKERLKPQPQTQRHGLHEFTGTSFAPPRAATDGVNVSGITARLRNMRGDDAGTSASPSEIAPPAPKTVDIGGSLSRLRALKGDGNGAKPAAAASSPATEPTPSVESIASAEAPPPPPRPTASGVQGSLARLKGLKGNAAPTTDPAPEPTASPSPASIDEASAALAAPVTDDDDAMPPPKPVKELGSAASRLSALRKDKD
ncbi:MAG: hypothetical protein AAF581_16410 [Planctomycetota bacterium]